MLLTSAALALALGCGREAAPAAAERLSDLEVFRVESSARGWEPAVAADLRSPELVIFGDGRIVRVGAGPISGLAPPHYFVARADPNEVERFAESVESSSVLASDVDLGEPTVSDQGAMTITLLASGGVSSLRIYAFDSGFEGRLSEQAREHRRSLREILARARAFAKDESAYVPASVEVRELPGSPAASGDIPRWPGPDPATFLGPDGTRGRLEGETAARVYAEAVDNPDALWKVNDNVRRFVVDPVP